MIVFITIGILQGGIMGYFAYSHARSLIFNNKKNEMENMLEKINISVTDKVSYMTQLGQSTATSQIVRNNIHSGEDYLQVGRSKRNIAEYFSSLVLSFEPLNNIMIIDRFNILYSTYDYYRLQDFDLVSSKYYEAASEHGGQPVWLGLQDNLLFYMEGITGPEKVLTMVEPITDFYNQEVIAVLIMDLNPDTFLDILHTENASFPHQMTFMLDQNQRLIAGDEKTVSQVIDAVCAMENRGGESKELMVGQERMALSVIENEATGWKIYTMVPYSDISAQVQSLNHSILLSIILCNLLILVCLLVVSLAITAPVKKLIEAMREVQQGNFDYRIDNKRSDEMGRLMETFNYMVFKIDMLIKEVYQEKLAQKNAELEALQSQINPHFLYNTLDTINWMLLEKKEYEISGIVVSLGEMMKYAISRSSRTVALREEIRHVSNYLLIQKERMEDKLEYEIDIPHQYESVQVPRLILQPLVENAIIHGIETGGKVSIRVYEREEDGGCWLEVSDNGAGMDEEQLKRLRDGTTEMRMDHRSIGVENVNKRIRLYYGEEFGLMIESRLGEGTVIRFCIPGNS
nr:sensor histidine kinase [Enterocloster bolteae]